MVAFVGANIGGANATTATIAWPATAAGYTALLLWSAQSTQTQTDPGGFTLQQSQVQSSGALNSRLLTRNCDGTESGTITITTSVSNKITGCLLVYSGLHPTSPVDTFAARNETSAGTTHACPSVTTGFADCVIATAVAERSSTGTNGWTPPSGYTGRADTTTNQTGAGMTITAVADDGLAAGRAAGTLVTPPAWTSGNGFSTVNAVTWTISLRPAVAGKAPQLISQFAGFF